MSRKNHAVRHMVLVLGDQLDEDSAAFTGFDPARDAVWMAENAHEATHVWCHKLRLAVFFSAMRHFAQRQRKHFKHEVLYHELTEKPSQDRGQTFGEILTRDIQECAPQKIIVVHPGDDRVLRMLEETADHCNLPLEVREDTHFYCSLDGFQAWAKGRKSLVMEYFYREMRKREDVLMDGKKPVGGGWNFDKDNRESFCKQGPPLIPEPLTFKPDAITKKVIQFVNARFADHPGTLSASNFDLPMTRDGAQQYLADFIQNRLPLFGTFEDAMWTDQPILYHSRLSFLLNVKLLNPRECVNAAVQAYETGQADIQHVEGFVRQILGWREFIRGIYWTHMPDYREMNALGCDEAQDVPQSFWDGQTDMQCVAQSMKQVIELGYAHHIQRLMVLGLFALQLGVHPRKFHDWHMAMYLDAIDWVSLPNTLGMSQYGDGGIVGTKPYCATGKYIDRMSNYCKGCRYNPGQATGDDACPITTLYWDFLDRHQEQLEGNHRMGFAMKNLHRKSAEEMEAIRERATWVRLTVGQSGSVPENA